MDDLFLSKTNQYIYKTKYRKVPLDQNDDKKKSKKNMDAFSTFKYRIIITLYFVVRINLFDILLSLI